MARPQLYTDEEILDKLRTHVVTNMSSTFTMSKPTWQGILKRMNKDEEFKELVNDIVAEGLFQWEQMGIKALLTGDETFNVQLFKHYTVNKKPFIDHMSLEIEERLTELENAKHIK